MTDTASPPDELLLVEDNPGDVRLIEEAFDEAELDTTLHVAARGEEAVEFVHRRGEFGDAPEPDMFLLDWNLPQMDSETLLGELESAYPHAPAVVLTGSEAERDAIGSTAPAADAFVTKPTEPATYPSIVRSAYAEHQ